MHFQAYSEFRQGINPKEDQKDRPGYLRQVIKKKNLEAKLMTAST